MGKSINEININMAQLIDEAIEQVRNDVNRVFTDPNYPPDARLEFIQTTYVPIIADLTAAVEKVTEVSRYF